MKKKALFTTLGLLGLLGGITIGYLFLTSINTSPNFIFLGLNLVLMSGGVLCLIKATNAKPQGESTLVVPDFASAGTEELLKKNNAISSEWSKTNNQRDKLKMLEMAANAEKS